MYVIELLCDGLAYRHLVVLPCLDYIAEDLIANSKLIVSIDFLHDALRVILEQRKAKRQLFDCLLYLMKIAICPGQL